MSMTVLEWYQNNSQLEGDERVTILHLANLSDESGSCITNVDRLSGAFRASVERVQQVINNLTSKKELRCYNTDDEQDGVPRTWYTLKKYESWYENQNADFGGKRLAVLAKTNGRCWYCGQELDLRRKPDDKKKYTIDHVDPQCQNGGNHIDNLVPACASCNSRKSGRCLSEYRENLAWKSINVKKLSSDQVAWLIECGFTFPPLPTITFYGETL